MNKLELLDYLSHCSIEFGIFDNNGNQSVNGIIYNTDDTITQKKLKVRDIMYMTEYGTITIPGKRILEKTSLYASRRLKEETENLIREIFEKDLDKSYIETVLKRLCLEIRDYIRNYMIVSVEKTNRLGSLIGLDEDQNKYIYDMMDLSKYIECKLKIQN